MKPSAGPPVDWQIREAEIDSHSPRLFLFQAIACDPGQSFDEGGLAMVDVASGANDHERVLRKFEGEPGPPAPEMTRSEPLQPSATPVQPGQARQKIRFIGEASQIED
jgi:hypothetical protein